METFERVSMEGMDGGVLMVFGLVYLAMMVLNIIMLVKYFQMCRHVREMRNIMRDTRFTFHENSATLPGERL